jgi:hypothetical protein
MRDFVPLLVEHGELTGVSVAGARHRKRIIKHYKHIQSVLRDYQYTVVASAALRRMAAATGTTLGENGFTYALLYSREQPIAEECHRQARNLL